MYPTLFKLGSVTVYTYGVVIAGAFLVTFLLLHKEARRKNFYPDEILDLELLILVSGIIGARTLHVLVNLDFYSKNLLEVFSVWKGGLAFHGGLILAASASWIFILKKKMPIWKTADFIAPYIALGHSIGRIGCFLNGCCFGREGHPTQIYASLALLGIFVILRFVQERSPFHGFVFWLYILLYSLQRFFIDFFRGDMPAYIVGLTVSQFISIALFAIGTVFIVWKRWKS